MYTFRDMLLFADDFYYFLQQYEPLITGLFPYVSTHNYDNISLYNCKLQLLFFVL